MEIDSPAWNDTANWEEEWDLRLDDPSTSPTLDTFEHDGFLSIVQIRDSILARAQDPFLHDQDDLADSEDEYASLFGPGSSEGEGTPASERHGAKRQDTPGPSDSGDGSDDDDEDDESAHDSADKEPAQLEDAKKFAKFVPVESFVALSGETVRRDDIVSVDQDSEPGATWYSRVVDIRRETEDASKIWVQSRWFYSYQHFVEALRDKRFTKALIPLLSIRSCHPQGLLSVQRKTFERMACSCALSRDCSLCVPTNVGGGMKRLMSISQSESICNLNSTRPGLDEALKRRAHPNEE